MKRSALPGLGDFSVDASLGSAYVTLPRNPRTTSMLAQPWVVDMHLHLNKRLKRYGPVVRVLEVKANRVQIFKITPAQAAARSGKKSRRRQHSAQDIWRAIKSFIKSLRRQPHARAAQAHDKVRLPVRRSPSLLPTGRVIAANH